MERANNTELVLYSRWYDQIVFDASRTMSPGHGVKIL
jgi:hypothetical protein